MLEKSHGQRCQSILMLDGLLLGHSRFCNKRKPPLSSLDTGADGICYRLPLKSAGGHCRSSAIQTVPGKNMRTWRDGCWQRLGSLFWKYWLGIKTGFSQENKKVKWLPVVNGFRKILLLPTYLKFHRLTFRDLLSTCCTVVVHII